MMKAVLLAAVVLIPQHANALPRWDVQYPQTDAQRAYLERLGYTCGEQESEISPFMSRDLCLMLKDENGHMVNISNTKR